MIEKINNNANLGESNKMKPPMGVKGWRKGGITQTKLQCPNKHKLPDHLSQPLYFREKDLALYGMG